MENKIEIVVPILELYESVEDDLRKIGIRIRLDVYDGMDNCIYANKNALKLCLTSILYYFIDKCPELSVLEISLKSYEERIWIIFRSAEEKYRSKRQTPIHNSEMDVIRGYLKTKGIFLREEKLPDEVEIGFENVDWLGGDNVVLEVKNIVYYYKTNKSKNVLNGISYKFEEGKVYAILGASGSGKTTFLSLLAGLDVPVLGTILYEEEDILKGGLNHHRKEHVSLVFQNYNLIDYLTPKENVMLGGNGNPEELLTAVGIQKEDWDRKVLQLSGGQQQRVAIARALASPAKVLLADEPTGNLDEDIGREVTELLQETAHKLGKCVIVVTHSRSMAETADVVIKIEKGKIHEENIREKGEVS